MGRPDSASLICFAARNFLYGFTVRTVYTVQTQPSRRESGAILYNFSGHICGFCSRIAHERISCSGSRPQRASGQQTAPTKTDQKDRNEETTMVEERKSQQKCQLRMTDNGRTFFVPPAWQKK